MAFIPVLALVATPQASLIAEKLAAVHQKLSGGVLVSDAQVNVVPTRVRLAPGVCTLVMPNQQIAEVRSTGIRFYDQIFNQVAAVKAQKSIKVPDAAPDVAQIHREILSWLLDSSQRNSFFADIKKDQHWQAKPGKLELVDPIKKVRSEVLYDSAYRVTEIRAFVNNKVLTDWKYQYVDASKINSIPSDARVVAGLPQRPALPQKSNPNAVVLSQKMWRSMSRLENRTVIQSNSEGEFRFTLKPGNMTEKGPKGSWTATNTSLTITPNKGAAKSLKGKTGKYLDMLHTSGVDPSPLAWYFLNRRVPFLDLFDQCQNLELEGSISIGGKSTSILKLTRQAARIRLYVEEKSGDLMMMSSDSLDARGNVINSSRLKISYQ